MSDLEKHISDFFSREFQARLHPESREAYRAIREILADKIISKRMHEKAGMKITKPMQPRIKYLTTCDPGYAVILNHLLYGKRGEHESMLVELAAILGKSISTAERTFTKNKSNVEKTADFIKNLSS